MQFRTLIDRVCEGLGARAADLLLVLKGRRLSAGGREEGWSEQRLTTGKLSTDKMLQQSLRKSFG